MPQGCLLALDHQQAGRRAAVKPARFSLDGRPALRFLYDDKMVITFNYKGGTDTITFDDLKAALDKENAGSDLDCSTAPNKQNRFPQGKRFCFAQTRTRCLHRLKAKEAACRKLAASCTIPFPASAPRWWILRFHCKPPKEYRRPAG